MKRPIQAGDLCLVVTGLGREKSPNAGLVVQADKLVGEHSQYGRVWRCRGAGVKQLSDSGAYITTGWADFPVAWLRKIEPPKPKTSASTSTQQEAQCS